MKIDKRLFDEWNELKSKKDVSNMVAENPGTNALAYYRVFRTGQCADDNLFKIISEYYIRKKQLVLGYVSETTKT